MTKPENPHQQTSNIISDNQLRKYVLGNDQLEDASRETIDRALLILDNDLLERIEMTEDQLVEEYLDDELTETEKDLFVENFMNSAHGVSKIRFTKALIRYARAAEE